jgi:putative pyruvate formate lyase activating enzyme
MRILESSAALDSRELRAPSGLERRIARADEMLRHCELCEWRCGINRFENESAPCRLGTETHCFKSYISLTEELELVPTLRVYLSGCNFRCQFCNVAPGCFSPTNGSPVDGESLAAELTSALDDGVKCINLLGGEPSLHVHTILRIAAASSTRLPLVLNTNMYMTPEVIELLDGVVVMYLADFKFGNNRCAEKLAGVPRYFETVTRNLLITSARTKLLVRHLLMPGHIECCFRPVADWMKRNLSKSQFRLHTGYVPSYRAEMDGTMGRLNTRAEVQQAQEYLKQLGLEWQVM